MLKTSRSIRQGMDRATIAFWDSVYAPKHCTLLSNGLYKDAPPCFAHIVSLGI
jgi:hypothetical protein